MPSIAIQVPYQAQPGMKIKAKLADGRSFLITVPEGAYYPTQLMVTVPEPPVVTTGSPMVPAAPVDLPADSKIEKMETSNTTMDEGVDSADLIACCAMCCIVNSLYCKWPACIGCHSKGQCTCLELESVFCKVGVNKGSLCMCCKQEFECMVPTTCVKMTSQMFCFDQRCAFPCDEEVPCTVAVCGLTICRDFACICKCFDKLNEGEDAEEGSGAPADEVTDKEEDKVEEEVMDRQ
jgi:hypothetical protein